MSLKIISSNKDFKYWNWNGFNIAWHVEREDGENPILLIHGFGASSSHWRNNIVPLSKKDYAVYSIDLLGFGNSDQPGIKQIGKLDNGIWCDQVTDFIREIIRPIHSKKIVIIGNSLGGLIALTCAVASPEDIAAIVASPLPDPVSLRFGTDNSRDKYENFKTLIIELFTRIFPIELLLLLINRFNIINLGLRSAYYKKDNIDDQLLDIIKKPAKRGTAARALRAMLIGMSTRSKKLKSSFLLKNLNDLQKVPFLLIWGEKDNFIPLFLGKRIAKLYPWVKLKVIANSGHCVHDEDHHKFNKICHQWIKELKTF